MSRDQRIRLAMAWMRRSHAAFNAGYRSDDIVAGERAYQKWRKRVQRTQQREVAA